MSHANALKIGRRRFVFAVALLLAVQALKLGSRYCLLGEPPTAAMWGQLILVAWLPFMLWDGHAWARGALALFAVAAAFFGIGLLVPLMGSQHGALMWIGLTNVVLSLIAALLFQFDPAINTYASVKITQRK